MVAWASSGRFENAAFLCICVDPDAFRTAKEFAQLYFKSAPKMLINGFIDSRDDFPNFRAQLGCQGFVVFNSAHELVTAQTLPFNEYRNRAFRDVEEKLRPLMMLAIPGASSEDIEKPDRAQESFDAGRCLTEVETVGHDAMDEQHDSCKTALVELHRELTVKQLRAVKRELEIHFEEEESLLRKYKFGLSQYDSCGNDADTSFSAFGSHLRDHKRIITLASDALCSLQNVCEEADARGGTVPKSVAENLCRAFVDHATMFDSLYEGKLFHEEAHEKVVGWYDFQWKGGSFPVCFRPSGNFFCPSYQAPSTWMMVEDIVKIDWGKFGQYEMKLCEAERNMVGHLVPKDETNESNWRRADFSSDLSDVEKLLFGVGAGTEWEFEWKAGKFFVKFEADGYNSFLCDKYPSRAHYSIEGNQITINWGNYGKYKLAVDHSTRTMKGGEFGGDQTKETWWRKASYIRNL